MTCYVRCEHCPGLTDVEQGPTLCDDPRCCADCFVYDVSYASLREPSLAALPDETWLIAKLLRGVRLLRGVGLAAPQIGVNRRVVVAQLGSSMVALVNPRITRHGRDVETRLEGCLSSGETLVAMPRWRIVTLEADGVDAMRLTGNDARVVQHELDHLDGRLIVDSEGAFK